MSVATNRGLMLRLDTAFVFTLAARLRPRYGAFQLFQYTEGIEQSTSCVFTVAAFITLFSDGSLLLLLIIPIVAAFAQLLEKVTRQHTLISKLMMPIFRVYALFTGFGIIMAPLLVTVYIFYGWKGIGIILLGQTISNIITAYFSFLYSSWYTKHQNVPGVGLSEQSLIYAYQYLAQKTGANMVVNVTKEEKESLETAKEFIRYASKYPKCIARYRDDMYTNFQFDSDTLTMAQIEVMAESYI